MYIIWTEHSSPNQNGGLYIDSYSIYLFINQLFKTFLAVMSTKDTASFEADY